MKRKLIMLLTSISIGAMLSVGLVGCSNSSKETGENITPVTTSIILSDDEIKIDGEGVSLDENKININSPGTFSISGTLSDGQLIIDNNTEENVYLKLNGVNLSCSNSSPIQVKNSKNTIISLEEGSENIISDGENYVIEDSEGNEPNATIYSKDDLTINGTGSLVVNANYNDGIASKDDLKITGGSITVNSKGDGLRGKDSIIVKDGNLTIDAGADGLKSTNSEDEKKGYITIEGGSLNIKAAQDAIQAETDLNIIDGEININSGGGSENSSKVLKQDFSELPEGNMSRSNIGEPPEGNTQKPNIDELPKGDMQKPSLGEPSSEDMKNMKMKKEEEASDDSSSDDSDKVSTKGVKAINSITIDGGTINIDSSDDAIHSNNVLTVNGGEISILSGDKGIHSDNTLTINSGNINVNKSYEGIESCEINISGGNTRVIASDDGINAAAKNVSSKSSESSAILNITDGYLYVDATGDGLDANGSIEMKGGTVIVNGPISDGDGGLDYDKTCNINGGTLIVAGSSGMAQSPSTSSSINSVSINLQSQEANTLVSISDESNNEIITFAPSKKFSNIVVASSSLKSDSTYNVSVGGSSSSEVSDGLYVSGTYTGGTSIGNFKVSSTVSNVSQSGASTGGMRGNREQGPKRIK